MASSSISDLWNKWNIRGSVLLSLSLQVFLILFAPLRKKIANRHIVFLLWLAYLMADSVVVYGIGFISHSQGNSCAHAAEVDISLQALWASFLLLHLGGPDTVTAFSLEDNSLWGRHLLVLIFQVGAAVYLFVQIFPSDRSLVIPTMLVFLAGVIKNAERILSLHLSSLPRLQESMLRRPELIEGEYLRMDEGVNAQQEATLVESIVVKHAYYFFQIFQVFIGDLIFKDYEREMSRNYFHKVSAMDALRVISVELNFMYEVLHTKVLVIRSKWSYIFRFVAFTALALALVLFNRLKKHRLPELDVDISHSLFFGGMALDVIALFMLIFSDWTVAGIKWYNTGSAKIDSFFHGLLSATDNLRKPRSVKCKAEPNDNPMYDVLDTRFIFRRWSESISACNLLSEFLKESPRKLHKHDQSWGNTALSNICSFPWLMAEKIISHFHQASETIAGLCGSREIFKIVNTRYVSKNPFIQDLWIFIFEEVRRKSEDAFGEAKVREIYEARGDLFLTYKPGGAGGGGHNLLRYVNEVSYDSSILCWHVATEIWYNMEKPTERNEKREFSKILSDYMLYLLLNQHDMVSGVAGAAQMTLADMVLDLSDYIHRATKDVETICRSLYDCRSFRMPELNQGVALVRDMEGLRETKWEVMSGVWVEMLSYAASHIKGEAHVRVLSKGGELLAFVWLLMAHFGCFYKPPWGIFYEPFPARYVVRG